MEFYPLTLLEKNMSLYNVPFVGSVEFPPAENNRWDFEADGREGPVRVNVNLTDGGLEDGLSRAATVFSDLQRLDENARDEIRKEYFVEPSTSEYFVRYFEEQYSAEEVAELFGTGNDENVGVEELLKAIRLEAASFNLGSDEDFLVLDYKLHLVENDRILVVYFNSAGVCQGLAVESM